MEFIKTKFKDAWLIKPQVFQDNRGFFLETYSRKKFSETGIEANFVQDNHSLSVKKGVLRGLLLRMTKGSVYDAIIDIRKDSSTFGKWEGFTLSAENFSMLFVPKGFLHGFMTLEDNTEFQYKCDNFYEPRSEGGIIWNDPTLNIDWPIKDPILSERDVKWGKFEDFNSPF
jgi:dTDP-4-dehydrorhamnose 3,5-epimerase